MDNNAGRTTTEEKCRLENHVNNHDGDQARNSQVLQLARWLLNPHHVETGQNHAGRHGTDMRGIDGKPRWSLTCDGASKVAQLSQWLLDYTWPLNSLPAPDNDLIPVDKYDPSGGKERPDKTRNPAQSFTKTRD